MLDPDAIAALQKGRHLLAFSGGVDSTALYHLLKELHIPCDIALVNYHTRPQSDEEEAYARSLAKEDDRRCFIHHARLPKENFEHEARRVRYAFFEEILEREGYDTLLTAHQLDDMLEWALMQLCRGAGAVELVGMVPVEDRKGYRLVRPLLFTPKRRLLDYLQSHDITYFQDASNRSFDHTRNRFRYEAASFLMEECSAGIARSFRYLVEDKRGLMPPTTPLFEYEELRILSHPSDRRAALRLLSKALKALGYLASRHQLEEIWHKKGGVLGAKWVVIFTDGILWIAPYRKTVMPKKFKERCRRARIPAKIRPYLFETEGLERLLSFLKTFSS